MKVLIADDHTFFREGLRAQLGQFESVKELQEVTTYEDLQALGKPQKKYDILFIDVDILGEAWKQSLREVFKLFPSSRIILLSGSENVSDIWEAFLIGVQGFITKFSSDAQNINALRLIMEGISYIPPAVLKGLPTHHKLEKDIPSLPSGYKLTTRQREVLTLLSAGLSNKEIAHRIDVSEATVKLHINALLRHLHVENRTKAVITAQRMGIL